jgi:sugar lactone lactonase YvrE
MGELWEVAVPAGAELGERPVWDTVGGCLIWVDIHAGRLHRHRPGESDDVLAEVTGPAGPVAVGAAAPRAGGGYVLAAADGFRFLRPDGTHESGPVRPPGMGDDVRFNDAACDPAGRLWAGTVAHDARPAAGALYRLDPDGTVTTVLSGVTESNGLGWSPDGRTMYYIDSGEVPPRVRSFSFDPAAGELGGARDLVTFPAEEAAPSGKAVPDGLVVDAGGCVWVALWGGGEVHRYSPAGDLLMALPVPVSQPTCPGFGGPELSELYVTTSWEGMGGAEREREPLAGHLLRADVGVRGLPATAFGG